MKMIYFSEYFDTLSRSEGNGSRNIEEEWLDENTTAAENEWSTAETTFYVSEAPPSKRGYFKELYDKHNGKGESDRKSTIRRSKIVKDAKTFVSILELPEYQREKIVSIAEDMDMSGDKYGGKPYEKILLAVCSLVTDEDLSNRYNASINDRLICRDRFKELMEVNNLGSREHNRIRQMIREKSDYF